ncbi:hypothetical protein GF325_04895, partial [Candidatus Bathyarchaeota archaeon]|nr:hypothetical protein [Candidatus Bathyarchaeota archaeon]
PFIIRDCVLVNAELTGLCGIHVGYSADARVMNCSIMYCDIGIHLEDCVNINLTSCNIEYIRSVGIACMVGERYTLVNNTVHHFEITGFAAYWCNDLSFIDNEISLGTLGGPVQGCYFDQVNDSRVFNNSVHDLSGNTDMYAATGFMFWRTHHCIVDANQAFNLQATSGLTSANGFYLMLSNNISLEHNQAFNLTGSMTSGSSGNGFLISSSNDTILQENNGYSTHGYTPNSANGFQIMNSNNCTLLRNLAYGNSGDVDYSGNGFHIHKSDYVNALDNYAWENYGNATYSGTGFLCRDSDHAFLANNSALNNSNAGFFLDSGMDANMFNNSASENSLHGVHLHGIDDFSIDGCQVNANGKLGILVNQCLGFNFVDNTTLLGNLKWLYQQDSSVLLGANTHIDRFGITVSVNDDLRYYSTRGSGTELDPFIIEDYNFNCTGMARHGVWITGTDAYFSLENCTILSTDPGYSGIFLENTNHAHIISCNSSYNGRGVHFRNVNSSTIVGNEINHNIDQGILLNDSHDNNITLNNLLFNHDCLQEDSSCTNNLVFGNTCDLLTPWWTSPSLPPPEFIHYRIGLNHTFSILWMDDYLIDEVIFHLDGINYTVEGCIDDNYSIEICDISGGIHQYRWFAKDTSRKMNQTALIEFNVLPVEPILELRINGTIGKFQGPSGSFITIEVNTNVQGGINIYNGSTYLCHQANTSWRFTHVGTLDIIACFSGNENYTGVNVSCKLKLTDPDHSPPDHQDLLIIIAIIALVSAITLMIHLTRKKQDKREPPPPPLLKKKPKDDECAWHGRKLQEPSFSCSQCGVHYCLECVLKLLRERDTCHFCGKPIGYFRLMHVMMDINGNLSGYLEETMKAKEDAGILPPSYYTKVRGKIMEEQQKQAKQASGSIMQQKGSQQQSQNYYKKVRQQVKQQQETEENHA